MLLSLGVELYEQVMEAWCLSSYESACRPVAHLVNTHMQVECDDTAWGTPVKPDVVVMRTIRACLKVCTNLSAAPFVAGWYGAPVKWVIPRSLQYAWNSRDMKLAGRVIRHVGMWITEMSKVLFEKFSSCFRWSRSCRMNAWVLRMCINHH